MATAPNIVGRVVGQHMLRPFAWPKSLTGFKLYITIANIVGVPCKRTQQVTTLLGPSMLGKTLGVIGQQCWVRLHGPLDGISKSLLKTSILFTAI